MLDRTRVKGTKVGAVLADVLSDGSRSTVPPAGVSMMHFSTLKLHPVLAAPHARDLIPLLAVLA